tara:strand:- start:370 stop:1011 length:642 start_codon:yes stop_codon:yes gene_type:complete
MAIVINGSGTVTGLAVGGLPDGTVDAGTLAANSVDSAELIDGAVDDSHIAALASSKLTGNLPAISGASLTNLPGGGKVLQVISDTSNTQYSTTATSWQSTDLSIAITPSSTSSKILCVVSTQTWINQHNAFCFMGIDRDGTNLGGQSWGLSCNHLAYQSGSGDDRNPAHMTYLDSPSSTSSLTYSFKFKSTYGTSKVIDSSMMSSLVLMEIGA